MTTPKLTPEQLAEQIHALAFDALDRRAYATAAALCRTLTELDAIVGVREMMREAREDRTVAVPLIGSTRQEWPQHGHVAIIIEGQSCDVCGTSGVATCQGCIKATPGSVRQLGGRCGQCGTTYLGEPIFCGPDCPTDDHEHTAPPVPARDAARTAAGTVSWLRGIRRGRDVARSLAEPTRGEGRRPAPGAPWLGEAPTETLPAVECHCPRLPDAHTYSVLSGCRG